MIDAFFEIVVVFALLNSMFILIDIRDILKNKNK